MTVCLACVYIIFIRKQWLSSLVLSRPILAVRCTSKCLQATHFLAACWGQQSRIFTDTSHSQLFCPMPKYTGLLPGAHASQALSWGLFPVTSQAHRQSLDFPAVFLPRLRSPGACVHPALVLSHPTLEDVLEMPSLVNDINITSALYLHNCVANTSVPPPTPSVRLFLLNLILFGPRYPIGLRLTIFLLNPGPARLASSQKLPMAISNQAKWEKRNNALSWVNSHLLYLEMPNYLIICFGN